jgi:hypothetical protein
VTAAELLDSVTPRGQNLPFFGFSGLVLTAGSHQVFQRHRPVQPHCICDYPAAVLQASRQGRCSNGISSPDRTASATAIGPPGLPSRTLLERNQLSRPNSECHCYRSSRPPVKDAAWTESALQTEQPVSLLSVLQVSRQGRCLDGISSPDWTASVTAIGPPGLPSRTLLEQNQLSRLNSQCHWYRSSRSPVKDAARTESALQTEQPVSLVYRPTGNTICQWHSPVTDVQQNVTI